MYKLKNTVIDRMVDKQLSSKEIDFILYIAQYQDDTGRVISVYYKDVCEKIDISVQKFYDILENLQKKDLISYEKLHKADVAVKIQKKNFSENNFEAGYLNVASTDFQNKKFRKMKAGAKLLYLYMQRFIAGKHMLVQKFYDEFCKLFHVTRKTLQAYLHELKKNYYLFVSKKRNKAANYEMTMKNSTVLKKKARIPREKEGYLHNIEVLIERNFVKYLPERGSKEVLRDIAALADSKRAEKHHDFISLIVNAVSESLLKQKKEGRKEQVLNAALVNKCLSDILEQQVMKRFGLA